MTTSFPTGLDSFTNPTSTDNLDQEVGTRTHSEMHGDINDAVEALQAKVGVDSSAVTTSHDYKLGFIRIGTNTPEGAVTAPVGALFLRTNGGTGTTLYVKESGAGNTGWVAVAVSAGGYATVKDSGSSETQRTVLDLQDGFVVTDDGAETEVDLDYGASSDIADVALADSAGVSSKVARADHVHGGFGFARKTAATARNTTTTLTDDPHLLFAIGASEVWIFEAVLFVTCTSATPDIKLDVTFPASAAFRYGGTGPASAVAAATGDGNFDEASLAAHDLTYGTINGDVVVIVKGICINSTNAGNITVRWSQATSDAADVTVQARSYIHGRRVS